MARSGRRERRSFCSATSAGRVLASSSSPDVSLSSRCTSSRNAPGRVWRICSMTPKLSPLPPWTATPAGLSMQISASSSWTTGNSRPGASGRSLRSATRTGGMRTSSPSARRVSAAARPLLTRTSPERMTRCRWARGTPLSTLARKLSSRWPSEPASMRTFCTRRRRRRARPSRPPRSRPWRPLWPL